MFILATSLSSQVNPDWRTYVMLAVYFFILLIIGYYGYKQATGDLSEYMLGGRNIGPYVTALSAGASDMSGWMIMGLPGEVYTTGLSAAWLAIGLTIGAYVNYILVAPRLRVYTEKRMTQSHYLTTLHIALMIILILLKLSLVVLLLYSLHYILTRVWFQVVNCLIVLLV